MKQKQFSLIRLVVLDQISKIKIFHMVASEHPNVVGGGGDLLAWTFLTLSRKLRIFPLILMVLFWMKSIRVVWERQLWAQV